MQIQIAVESRATIGESPTWVPEDDALYWIDIKAPALYCYDTRQRSQRAWAVSSDIGGFALFPDRRGALVALRKGLFRLDFAAGELECLAEPPYDPALFRFNEGACDATGRFWIGVMFDPLDPDSPAQPESLHSFTLAGGLRDEPDAAELHNGMAWSPDGKTFYLTHSRQHEVFAFTFDAHEGRLGARRSFVKTPPDLGVPDGAAVDDDGGYWCALHGGGRLHRYTPAGKLDAEILLPVSQPTMCAFAGDPPETLYVTSARDRLSAAQLDQEPLAGALLYLQAGRRGVPRRHTLR